MYQRVLPFFICFLISAGALFPANNAYEPLSAFLATHSNPAFYIQKITWNTDVPTDRDELEYRAGVKPQRLVSREVLMQSVKDLRARPRYKDVSLAVTALDADHTVALSYTIKSHWVLDKVVIRGINWGKPLFLDLYQIQQGEVFDTARHEESVRLVTQQLANEGYCDALVTEELEYNETRRSIKVTLKLERGKKTIIRHPTVVLSFARDHDEKCKKKLESLAATMLEGHIFSKKNLKAFVKKAYKLARDRGYSSTRITIDSFKKLESRQITFTARIQLGERFSLSFSGNTLFTSEWLREQFLGTMYPEWLVVPELIAEQIKLEYRKRGYFDAVVTPQALSAPGAYHFAINEGECYRIRQYKFVSPEGLELNVPPKVLKSYPVNKPFSEKGVKTLIFDVVTYFQAQGYWGCNYVSRKLEAPKKGHDVSLVITLSLDKQRLLKAIEIPHFEELLEQRFFEKYLKAAMARAPFGDRWIAEQKKYLLDHFHKQGFWYAVVDPQLVTEDSGAAQLLVSVRWHITLGDPVKVGKTSIEGASRLSHKQIQRFMRAKEGDVWTPTTVSEVRKRLKDTGLFKQVSVQTPGAVGTIKPLMVNVIDDDPYELLLRIGYFVTPNKSLPENLSTHRAGMSFNVKNPFNMGDKFSLKADHSRFTRQGKVLYSLPPWTNVPLSLTAEAAAEKHKHYVSVFGSDDHYHLHKKSGSILWDYERHEDVHILLHHGLEYFSFDPSVRQADFAKQFLIDESLLNKSIFGLFFEQRVVTDNTNDRFNPTRGDAWSVSARFFAPTSMGVTPSLKVLYEHSWYFPLKHEAVLALRFRGGYLMGKPLHKAIPAERFFLGGHTTVRGYDKDAVPPVSRVQRDVPSEARKQNVYTAHGGIGMVNTNAEFRIPVYGPLGTVVFQDVGLLTKDSMSGLFRNTWPTTGCGLRYQSPLGAIRFDVGWKWRKAFVEENRYTWYLTIGHAF